MFESHEIKSNESVTIKIPGVSEWTTSELRRCCKGSRVKGYTKMNREQLIEAVNDIIRKSRKEKKCES